MTQTFELLKQANIEVINVTYIGDNIISPTLRVIIDGIDKPLLFHYVYNDTSIESIDIIAGNSHKVCESNEEVINYIQSLY